MTDPCHSLTFNYEIELNCFSINEQFLGPAIRGGERVNRKVLGVIAVLIAVAMLATPVLAVSPKKIPVNATQAAVPSPDSDTKTWTTNGGITHQKNLDGAGTVTLYMPRETLTGSCTAFMHQTTNSKTGVGVWHTHVEWNFGNGIFEGAVSMKVFGVENVKEFHAVLQGSGDFKGWTLTLNGEGPRLGPMNWEGFLLIP